MQAEAANANRPTIIAALQQAAEATGADFHYLLTTATRESDLNPSASAGTSSGAGLFQFVEQTWLGVIKSYGAIHGLGSFANAIRQGKDGRFSTSDPSDRAAILALRNNAQIASLMEGEFAHATRCKLERALGRTVCSGELYAAHFLGEHAACRLIQMHANEPDASAADAFPAAATANQNVFFHRNGTPKTVREVYDWALSPPSSDASPGKSAAPQSHGIHPTKLEGATYDTGSFSTTFLVSAGILELLADTNDVANNPDAS